MQRPCLELDRAAASIRALKGNRTLDLLLTMETLCRLSYQGNPVNLTHLLARRQFGGRPRCFGSHGPSPGADGGLEPPWPRQANLQPPPLAPRVNLPYLLLLPHQ